MLECVVCLPKIIRIRVTVNPMSLYAIMLLMMCMHGLVVGVYLHNKPFEMFNDLIPLLMIFLHTLRVQSFSEQQTIHIERLLKEVTVIAFTSCCILFISKMLGNPSWPKLGATTIFLPLFFAGLFFFKSFPKWVGVCSIIMILMSLDNFNRTSMLFLLLITLIYLFITLIQSPGRGLIVIGITAICACMIMLVLDKNSPTYQRIEGISRIDGDRTTGSVGERNSEWLAINAKLRHQGETIHWLGLGLGGLYEVAFTHEYIKDYGHAHYGWAWFKLRFGKLGYVYLTIFLMVIAYNALAIFRHRDALGCFISLLSIYCLLYVVTYVNAIFLLSGINLYYRSTKNTDKL
jgi:hypothetical protein